MYFIIEALFVGLYTLIIYLFCSSLFINNKYILLFIIGFIKHFMGYYLNLHYYYCNYKYKCKILTKKLLTNNINLIIESILEGILFLFLGNLLLLISYFQNNIILLFFIIGLVLHILFELLGFHNIFCRYKCK
jgi:hypothetical protein